MLIKLLTLSIVCLSILVQPNQAQASGGDGSGNAKDCPDKETGPHTGKWVWKESPSSSLSGESISGDSEYKVLFGGSITEPTINGSYSDGTKDGTQTVKYDCSANEDNTDSETVSYTADTRWSPVIPSSFTKSGEITYTAKIKGTSGDSICKNISETDVGTITVKVCAQLQSLECEVPPTHKFLGDSKSIEVTCVMSDSSAPLPMLKYMLKNVDTGVIDQEKEVEETTHTFEIKTGGRYKIEVQETLDGKTGVTKSTKEFVFFTISADETKLSVDWDDQEIDVQLAPIKQQMSLLSQLAQEINKGEDACKSLARACVSLYVELNQVVKGDYDEVLLFITSNNREIAATKTAIESVAKQHAKVQSEVSALTAQVSAYEKQLLGLTVGSDEYTDISTLLRKAKSARTERIKYLTTLIDKLDTIKETLKGLELLATALSSTKNIMYSTMVKLATITKTFDCLDMVLVNSVKGVLASAVDAIKAAKASSPLAQTLLKLPILDIVFTADEVHNIIKTKKHFDENMTSYDKMAETYEDLMGTTKVSRKVAPLSDNVTITTVPGGVRFLSSEDEVHFDTDDQDLPYILNEGLSDWEHLIYYMSDKIQTTTAGESGVRPYFFDFYGNHGKSKLCFKEEGGSENILVVEIESTGRTEEEVVGIVEAFNIEQKQLFDENMAIVKAAVAGIGLVASIVTALAYGTAFAAGGWMIAIAAAVAGLVVILFSESDIEPVRTAKKNFPISKSS